MRWTPVKGSNRLIHRFRNRPRPRSLMRERRRLVAAFAIFFSGLTALGQCRSKIEDQDDGK
jgi:hypothetical protein